MQDTRAGERLEELRELVAEVLEMDAGEIKDGADFRDSYDADSIRGIEILSRVEKRYSIEIPQSELPHMQNLNAVYEIAAKYAGWPV
jgi:acyl carrier protein